MTGRPSAPVLLALTVHSTLRSSAAWQLRA